MIFFEKYKRYFQWSIPVLAFLLYANTIPNDYNMDDELVTINHRNTSRGLSAISDIFSQYYYEDDMGYKYEYRPIAHLSFALEHELFGESPHISHLINCLLYALLCLMLYKLLLSFFPQNMALLAFMATLLFVFHPIHTEVVASIKNRDELLAVLFGICGALLFKKSFDFKKQYFLIAAIALFLIALHAKFSVLPLIFTAILSMVLFSDQPFKKIIYATFPIFLLISFFNYIETVASVKIFIFSYSVIIFFAAIKKLWLILSTLLNIYLKLTQWIKKSFTGIVEHYKRSDDNFFEAPSNILLLKSQKLYVASLCFFIALFAVLAFYFNVLSFLLIPVFIFHLYISPNRYLLYISIFTNALLIPVVLFLGYTEEPFGIMVLLFTILYLYTTNSIKVKYYTWIIFLGILVIDFFIIKTDILFLGILLILFSVLIFVSLAKTEIGKKIGLFILFSLTILFTNQPLPDYFVVVSFGVIICLFYILFLRRYDIKRKLIFTLFLWFSVVNTVNVLSIKKVEYESEMSEIVLDDATSVEIDRPISFSRPLHFIETPVNVHEPMSLKLATGMYVFGKYLQKTLVPYPMSFYYGYAYITPKTFNDVMPWVMLGVFIFLGLLTLYWIVIKQYVLAFGLIIYLAGTFQALGIYVPIPGAMGDRFLFIPSIGFCILLAYPFYKAIGTKWQRPALAILAIILVAYGYLTIQRNFQWKDRIKLFEADIEYLDKSAQAHALLADAYMRKATSGNVAESEYISLAQKAIFRYEKAISIYPDFLNFHFFKGKIQETLGQYEPAIASYKKAIALEKDFSYEPYLSIGSMYFEKQNYQEAAHFLEQTILMGFKAEYIYNTIFLSYINMGLFDKALSTINDGLKDYPNNYDMNLNKAKLLLNSGNIEQALIYFKIADRINPGNPEIKAILQEFDSL